MTSLISVGVSSCLLGNCVRYDGGHKGNSFITDTLSNYFQFVPVCPEVECGLPVPREAMRLAGDMDSPRLLTLHTGIDHTKRMQEFSGRKVAELKEAGLCGFIYKSNSPSCGLFGVKVYHLDGHSFIKRGRGLFAAAMAEHFPRLPMEEEGRLQDARLREIFLERVFNCKR
jgi:uncharacterized protein YbbK (DUF523 family)